MGNKKAITIQKSTPKKAKLADWPVALVGCMWPHRPLHAGSLRLLKGPPSFGSTMSGWGIGGGVCVCVCVCLCVCVSVCLCVCVFFLMWLSDAGVYILLSCIRIWFFQCTTFSSSQSFFVFIAPCAPICTFSVRIILQDFLLQLWWFLDGVA